MQMSARILGLEYGLTAEEMNRVLVKQGFLTGSPGAYSLTEKALPYAEEKDFHRGNGGYSWYNRAWTTRTFDDSITNELHITDDLINEVRMELSAYRAARRASDSIEDTNPLLSSSEVCNENSSIAAIDSLVDSVDTSEERLDAGINDNATRNITEILKKVAGAGIITIIVVAIAFFIYKIVSSIAKWWRQRKIKQ